MHKILIILPYFGKFPSYFSLFLKSCQYNPTIDWLIITDIKEEYDYPENVKVVYKTFDDLKAYFQNKFDFQITLHKPYKLCDYRPAYGYIFEEYVSGYDFWGHCDLDLLFGDLRSFITEDKLNKYDKIGHLGHLTLYRNSDEINKMFLYKANGIERFREVFTTENSCIFDEWDDLSINKICLYKENSLYLWNDFLDIYPFDDNLLRVTRKINMNDYSWSEEINRTPLYITWENGKVFSNFRKKGKWYKEEFAYVHFQKRKMDVCFDEECSNILCLPDRFVSNDDKKKQKYLLKTNLHRVFNKKRIKKSYQSFRYKLIVLTAPIRHKFRKKI